MRDAAFELRRRILRVIEDYPGLHVREIARQADVSEQNALYHIEALFEDGLLEERWDQAFRRLYAKSGLQPNEADRAWMDLLRRPVALHAVVWLLENPGVTLTALAAQLGLAKSTASHHLRLLTESRIVETRPDGSYAIADPRRVRRLLSRWKPPETLVTGFARLWLTFYEGIGRTP